MRGRGLLLLLTPVIWGTTFPAGKRALETLSVASFTAWSRGLGLVSLLVTLVFLPGRRTLRLPVRRYLEMAIVLGGLMFLGLLLQTAGLDRTTATNAGFVTGLYVVFTPLLGLALYRRPVGRGAWAAVALSVVGLALLSVPGLDRLRPRTGDLLVLGGAVMWAAHVVAVGQYARRLPALPIAVAQLAGASLFHTVVAAPGGLQPAGALDVWPLLIITGVLGSGVAFTIQVVAQGAISATRAAIVLAGESVVAAFASALWLGERLDPHQWVGATLAVGAMVLSEVGARRRPETRLDPATAI